MYQLILRQYSLENQYVQGYFPNWLGLRDLQFAIICCGQGRRKGNMKANGFQGRAFTHFVVELSDGPVWEVQQIATKKTFALDLKSQPR